MEAPLIFIVDDEDMNRLILRQAFRRYNYDVQGFASGKEVLKALEYRTPDLILLDISMPVMDGFEVCEKITANPQNEGIPIIFVTAVADMQNRYKGLSLGAVDYIVKPFDMQEIRLRVEQHLKMHNMYQTIKKQNDYMRKELDEAQKIQRSLLPANNIALNKQTIFSYSYFPCETLAGDFLDIFQIEKNHWFFYMTDVSGHGVASSLITAFVKEFFLNYKNQPVRKFKLGQMLADLNKTMLSINFENRYLTIFLAVINSKSNEIKWASAGPNTKPFIISPNEIRTLENNGLPVGWFDDASWKVKTTTLPPESMLFLYSDAAIEIKDHHGTELGIDGLKSILSRNNFYANADFDKTVKTLLEYSGKSSFDDDLTLLTIKQIKEEKNELSAK